MIYPKPQFTLGKIEKDIDASVAAVQKLYDRKEALVPFSQIAYGVLRGSIFAPKNHLVAILLKTGLNNVVLLTLFTVVNDILRLPNSVDSIILSHKITLCSSLRFVCWIKTAPCSADFAPSSHHLYHSH